MQSLSAKFKQFCKLRTQVYDKNMYNNGAAMCKLHTQGFCGMWKGMKMMMEKKKSKGVVILVMCLQLSSSVIFPNTLLSPHHHRKILMYTFMYVRILKSNMYMFSTDFQMQYACIIHARNMVCVFGKLNNIF